METSNQYLKFLDSLLAKPSIGAIGKTGLWRTFKPIYYRDKCIRCLLCWLYCPENAIDVNEDKTIAIDYDYCKGCGICASICPKKAIEMIVESE
ncbi:MAG: ferredoxin [Thermoprotei archaeon]|nr:MAG: ferredoxin [Thermoprotei archaeon]